MQTEIQTWAEVQKTQARTIETIQQETTNMMIKYVVGTGEEFSTFEEAKKREVDIVHNKLLEVVETHTTAMSDVEQTTVMDMLTDNPTMLASLLEQYATVNGQTRSDVMALDDDIDLSDGTET